jgi:hypothetical protein
MSTVLLVTNYQMKDFYDLFICFFIRWRNRDGSIVWASLDARWTLLIAILFCYYGSWICKNVYCFVLINIVLIIITYHATASEMNG